jgi:hypothetical protein
VEVQQIIRGLDEEIARLLEARALLAGEAKGTRRAGSAANAGERKHSRLSEAGRRRISAALKRRWAARRKALAKANKSSKGA